MFKKLFQLIVFSSLLISFNTAVAGENIKFVLDFQPASILVADDIDDFALSSRSGYIVEYVDGNALWTPSLKAGVGFNVNKMISMDVTAGLGYLVGGEVLSAPFYLVDVSANFKLGKAITLGPHLSYIMIDELEWDGVSDADFGDTSGIAGGLAVTAGHEKMSFSLSVDVVSLDEVDVEGRNGWHASQPSMDLSGWMVNMGIKMKF